MEQKIAIITGASGGIGRAISFNLAKTHSHLILTYFGSSEPSKELKTEIQKKYDVQIDLQKLDVADEDNVKQLFKYIKDEYKTIDTLINNAGITNDMLSAKMKLVDFTKVIDTNLTGTFLMSQAALKLMTRKRSGAIVNISSVIGINGNIGQANYAASKAGVIALTKSLAKEYGRRNIRINAVAPGFISSPMTDVLDAEYREKVKEAIAMRRFGTAEEVANVVEFLVSNQSSYVTGQTLVIDGMMG